MGSIANHRHAGAQIVRLDVFNRVKPVARPVAADGHSDSWSGRAKVLIFLAGLAGSWALLVGAVRLIF